MLGYDGNALLITFDVEEFDLPADLGRRVDPGLRRRAERQGVEALAALLPGLGRVTCFVTAAFALEHPALVRRLASAGCEIACHGAAHGDRYPAFAPAELRARLFRAREDLQRISEVPVRGHRGPRFSPAPAALLADAGFSYDSSVHPTWVPGRYNHLGRSLVPSRHECGLWQVPLSVVPGVRLPVSWIWLRNLPGPLLDLAAARLVSPACLYLHAWELCDLGRLAPALPWPVRRNTGPALAARLVRLCAGLRARGFSRRTVSWYVDHLAPRA